MKKPTELTEHHHQVLFMNLPLPPSMNHVWKPTTIKGRASIYMSKEGREYRAVVIKTIQAMKLNSIKLKSRLNVKITLNFSDKRKTDIDNRVKACLDSLTHAGIWEDDSQIDELTVIRGEIIKGGNMTVLVKEI